MDFCFSNFRRWLIVAAAVTAVSGAQAQSFVTPGQAIIFSAPDDGDAASNAPSLAPQSPAEPGFGDTAHAPDFNFQTPATTSRRLPAQMPATISADEADRRANWALLTPAEILGVATPEQELKVPERDAAGRRKNSTAVERFYERQNQPQTNGTEFLPGTLSLRGNSQDNEDGLLNANVFKPSVGGFGDPAQAEDSFQTPAPGKSAASSRNGDEDWLKIFISADTKPAQSPSQAADLAEFRKLLEPIQTPKSSSASSGDGLFSTLKTPVFGQSANPSVPSSGLFNNGVGGYPVFPGVAGQSIVPTVKAVPNWKPQLPPWMLKGPQPGVVPQRQF